MQIYLNCCSSLLFLASTNTAAIINQIAVHGIGTAIRRCDKMVVSASICFKTPPCSDIGSFAQAGNPFTLQIAASKSKGQSHAMFALGLDPKWPHIITQISMAQKPQSLALIKGANSEFFLALHAGLSCPPLSHPKTFAVLIINLAGSF